jgi:hypothetical protein
MIAIATRGACSLNQKKMTWNRHMCSVREAHMHVGLGLPWFLMK